MKFCQCRPNMNWHLWWNFGMIDDVIATWWRHHLLKMPKIWPPLTFFHFHFFAQILRGNSTWHIFLGRRINFCHLSVSCILQTGLKLPFLPKFALRFYISGLENAIDLKFWPVVGIGNTSLLSKFQRNRISSMQKVRILGKILTGL